MFPIWDARGEPVGFGGRALDAQGPKYKNTADTSSTRSRVCSTGLHWAKGEIVARGEVIICEGYTDVMAFVLAGVPNAVATCGTALADEHFLTLKNLARKVVLAYDADGAGQAAAERCYQWEQRYEVQFQVADLEAGSRSGRRVARRSRGVGERGEGRDAVPRVPHRAPARGSDLSTFEGRALRGRARGGDDRRAPQRSRARPVRDAPRRSARHRTRSLARDRDESRSHRPHTEPGPTHAAAAGRGRGRPARARCTALGGAVAGAHERPSARRPLRRSDRA